MVKNERRRKTLQELNLCDDFLFAKVMENKEICRRVLEKILELDIKKVEFIESQLTKDVSYDAKSVRLDIYLDDDEKNVYAVEMQTANQYNINRRARYCHSILDVDQMMKKGIDYEELKENYVIFICTFDYFKKGLHKYSFESICREDNHFRLEDGTQTVILNTKGTAKDVDPELEAFLQYIETSTDEVAGNSKSALLEMINSQVRTVKNNKDAGVEYMKFDELIRESRREGKQEGIKATIEICREMKIPKQTIIDSLVEKFELTEEQAREEYLKNKEK